VVENLAQTNYSLIVTNSEGFSAIAPNALTVSTGGVSPFLTSAAPLSATEGDTINWYGSNLGNTQGIALLDCFCLSIETWANTSGSGLVPVGIYPGEKTLILINSEHRSSYYTTPITIYIPEPVEDDYYYYPKTIENVTEKFIDLFNNIKVKKYNSAGTPIQIINVPVMWGPVDKFYSIRKENYNETNNPYYQKFPRISITGPILTYNSDRATSVNAQRQFYNETLALDSLTDFYEDIQPVAYDYAYTVVIRTNKMEQLNQILESTLPYWNPSRNMRVKEFSFLNIERDLKVIFDGNVNIEYGDPYEENQNRVIECTLNFTINGFMYLPVRTSKIIKIVESQYFIDTTGSFTSASSILDANYETSGYKDADDSPSSFDLSAYNDALDIYTYTDDKLN
jgi:hypothetical protein